MEQEKKSPTLHSVYILPFLFSSVFVAASLHIHGLITGLFYFLLLLLSMVCINEIRANRKSGTMDRRAAGLLLAAITIDYWVWALFASYPGASSYVLLGCVETMRIISIILLLRHIYGGAPLKPAFTVWAIRIFVFDFLIVITSRAGGGAGTSIWDEMHIYHPLFLVPLLISTLIQVNLFALYVVRFRASS